MVENVITTNKTGLIHGTRENETDPSKRYHIEDRFLKKYVAISKRNHCGYVFSPFGELVILFHFGKLFPLENNTILPVDNVLFEINKHIL